jgi:hypothetical protein
MKKLILPFIMLNLYFGFNQLSAQAPNPPDKICFNYDLAGNRIAQNPAWFSHFDANNQPVYNPDCTPTENTISTFGGKIILIKNVADLDIITSWSNVRWVLNVNEVPIGIIKTTPVLSPTSFWVVNNPHDDYAVVLDLQNIVKGTDLKNPIAPIDAFIVPNPNLGQFKLEQSGFETNKTEVLIFDTKGALMMKRDYVNGFFNISEYSTGNYLLIIKDSQNSKVVRFTKEQ